MKRIIQSAVLAAALAGCAVADDGLDEALARLKKKVRRQTYSTQADLHNRNMDVPKEQSEEDKALDEKLRQIEKGLNQSSAITSDKRSRPRMIQNSPAQSQDNRNWLTPALLDNTDPEEASLDDEKPDWVAAELERQQNIRIEQEALEKESANDSLFNNPFQQQQDSSSSKLNSYGQSFQNIISAQPSSGSKDEEEPRSGWLPSQKERSASPFSLSSRREKAEEEESSYDTFSRFKSSESVFGTKRKSSAKTPWSITPSYGIKESDSSPNSLSPSWKKEKKPLQPIEQIRKSSPIHKKDPFSDDFMPQIKKGIWE